MLNYLTAEQEKWCTDRQSNVLDLLKEIGRIPAPSHNEGRRAQYIYDWLRANGAGDIRIDPALNVVLCLGDCSNGPLSVVLAHTDIVFTDTDDLPMKEDEERIFAPGIGDDTANLVNMLFAAKYMLDHERVPKHGVLIVADSCEEGLGNLKGSRQIVSDFGNRIERWVSLDLYTGMIVSRAVGSHRYKITIHAKGGHAYGDFGNTNAIEQMAQVINALYRKHVPEYAKTTYNVGVIHGGTTINSICAECSILYEYRSEAKEGLSEMQKFFEQTIDDFRNCGFDIEIEKIGDRPCGGDVDHQREAELENELAEIMKVYTGRMPQTGEALSTDCNAALAAGIPSVCIGTVAGSGAHTREEWIEKGSMQTGLKIALCTLEYLFRQ